MDELKQWLGDVFYKDVTISEAHEGYVTEYYRNSYNSGYETVKVELPFEETITIQKQELDMQAVGAFILIVMTFLTVVTWLRGALK